MSSVADRIRDALLRIARSGDPSRDFHGLYEYVVASQSAKTISCRPADDKLGLPELTDIPLRPGILGGTSRLTEGSTVIVGFVNGSPTRPEILFASRTEEVAVGGELATSPRVLRVGDNVTIPGPGGGAAGVISLVLANPLPGAKLQ